MLLDNKANINLQNIHGNTALTLSCGYSGKLSNIETIRILLENKPDRDNSRLSYILYNNNCPIDVCRLMISLLVPIDK